MQFNIVHFWAIFSFLCRCRYVMVSQNEIVSDDLCPSKTCTLKALWENWGRHVELRNEVTNTKEK